MTDYYVPRVQIEQEFTQSDVLTSTPLAALIIGPQYKLLRYTEPTEQASTVVLEHADPVTNVNKYVGTQRTYDLQGKTSTDVTDLTSEEVWFDNVLAAYYTTPGVVTKVANTTNQITSATLVFKTGNNNTRTAGIHRDVAVGDYVKLASDQTATPASSLTTRVVNLLPSLTSPVAPQVAKILADAQITMTCVDSAGNSAAIDDYTGARDIIYRVIVEQGGTWGAARVKVLSNDVDSSGPYTVDEGGSNRYALGTQGLYFAFSAVSDVDDVLATGDSWTVTVTTQKAGKYNIIVTADDVPLGWASYNLMEIQAALSDVLIPQIPDLSTPDILNWTNTQTGVTIDAGITVQSADIATGGVPDDLPVRFANVYVSRRDIVIANTSTVSSVATVGEIENKLGTIHPLNTLAKGVYNAVLNASGCPVYFVAVATDDLAGYTRALELAKKDNKYYGLVPLTTDATVQAAVVSHVNLLSTAKQAKWRVCWLSLPVDTSAVLVGNQTSGDPFRGTVGINPVDSTYSVVTIAGATMLDAGVKAGDTLNYDYYLGPDGNIVYSSTPIVAVNSNTVCVVANDFGAAIALAFKVTITRDLSSAEKTGAYLTKVQGFDNRRVRLVFPDTYKSGSLTEPGYLLAASLAGLRAGSVPHQGLTNIEVVGPTDLSRVTSEFNEDDLDRLAAEGLWIVTQTATGQPAYTRHQLTTDTQSLIYSEDSVTANVDSVSYGLQAALAPYIGIYNINAGSILKVRAAIDKELSLRVGGTTFTERAGSQLLGYTIVSIAQDTLMKDKLVVVVRLQVPAPMNYITVTLLV